jgi:ABC-type transport system involved in multi-copper enzyme maturation permease subunit
MKDVWAVTRREFWAYFNSPIAYIFIIVFGLINCALFMVPFFILRQVEMRAFFTLLPYTLAVFIPAVSMRLWAEERRSATMSLLLSLPLRSRSLVAGKFFASLAFYLITLASTAVIPITVFAVGEPDSGPIIGGYIGAIFLGALFLSVGIFVSALSRDQIVAFVLSVTLCFGLYLVGTDYVAPFIDSWVSGLGSAIKESIGTAAHYASFERGVIDLSNIIYFLAFTIGFLVLNAFALESRIRLYAKKLFATSVPLVLGLAVAASAITGDMRLGRFDLTESRMYTVSPSAKAIISRLKAPVKVRLYISPKEKMPSFMKNMERDLTDKLGEFSLVSKNFTYEVIEPGSDIEALKKLEEKGILPFSAMTIERDARETRRVYCALTISYLDKPEDVIGRMTPEALGTLEYELVSRIYRMTLASKVKAAVFAPEKYPDPRMKDPNMRKVMAQSGRPVPEPVDNFKKAKQMLTQNGYEVVTTQITKSDPIPQDAKLLLIVAPEQLNQRQLYEIDRFLTSGGGLIMAAQSYQYNYSAVRGVISVEVTSANSGVNEILGYYGSTLSDEILMDPNCEILNISAQERIGNMNVMTYAPVKLPIQMVAIAENMNKSLSITDRLPALFYPWGSALKLNRDYLDKNKLTYQVLVSSSTDSWTIPSKTGMLTPSDFDISLKGKAPGRVLSVLIEGTFPGAFSGKPRPEYPKEEGESPFASAPEPPETPISPKPGKLLLIGCTEMFNDSFLSAYGNAIFLLNAVDALAAGEELMSIRSKTETAGYFTEILPGSRLFYRFFTMGLVPAIFIGIGVLRSVMRTRRRRAYIKSLTAAKEADKRQPTEENRQVEKNGDLK